MSEVSLIQFHGIEIEAVEQDSMPFANLRRMCESLGVDHSSQTQKLKSTHWACVAMIATHDSCGRMQEMSFLSADSVPMWLATIKEAKVAEHVRPLLRELQLNFRDVLYRHFSGKSSSIAINDHSLMQLNVTVTDLQQQYARIWERIASQQEQWLEYVKKQDQRFDQLIAIAERIDDRTKGTREEIQDKDKKSIIAIVERRFGGACPCCMNTRVTNNGKRIPDVSQFDHFHHRSMAAKTEVWLVCKQCNRRLRDRKPSGFWMQKTSAFQHFQQVMSEGGQRFLAWEEAK
jgi:prophage antirepressor-like protein